MKLRIQGIPTAEVEKLRTGSPDANGQPAQVRIAEGTSNPCRHCLGLIAPGDELLVLGYRPFASAQPYAETGPIFLHRAPCTRYDGSALPGWFAFLDPAAIRGYGANDWIRYETGQIVRGSELTAASEAILSDDAVAYVHIRSKFGCFQCRVERG
jgi:hypothetical protein